MVKLERFESFMKPLYYGKTKIETYVFYHDGMVLYRSAAAYLEDSRLELSKGGKEMWRKYPIREIELPELKRARKENLYRKDNYIIGNTLYLYSEPSSKAGENSNIVYHGKGIIVGKRSSMMCHYKHTHFSINGNRYTFEELLGFESEEKEIV